MVSDRAKTRDEKKLVIKRLYRVWLENPDLRLGQLIENVYRHDDERNCFYAVEDFELIAALEKFYGQKNEKLPN